jgi:hypothetical protein
MPHNNTKWEKFRRCLEIIQALIVILGFPIGIVGIYYANQSFESNNKISSANFVLQISNKLDGKSYEKIMTAIEDNTSDFPILTTKKRKGFKSNEVEDYIGNFETIGDLIRDKIVNPKIAYDELGYDAEKAWCNKDVQKVIADSRQADNIFSGSTAFYAGFEEFAKFSLSKDRKNCSDMDKE